MKFKHLLLAACVAALAGPALAQETDGIKLPPGFHATVVADKLGVLRHITFRDNDNLYMPMAAMESRTASNWPRITLDRMASSRLAAV